MIMIEINKKLKYAKTQYDRLVEAELKKINATLKKGDVCVVETDCGRQECGFFVKASIDDCDNQVGVVWIADRRHTRKGDKRPIVYQPIPLDDIISIAKYE